MTSQDLTEIAISVNVLIILVLISRAIVKKVKSPVTKGAALGGLTGGCSLPFILLLLAAALGDTGGPLFWPILSLFLALVLGVTGAAIGAWMPKKEKPAAQTQAEDS